MTSTLLGVIVIARNGERYSYYQDPYTYSASDAESSVIGEITSHYLGIRIHEAYFANHSLSYIPDIRSDPVDNRQVKVQVKAGVEGTVVFNSALALLQGIFQPTPNNNVVLPGSHSTVLTAPLDGYQYVPIKSIEPAVDRSLESWTDCPAFEKHIDSFYKSADFKAKAREAAPFFKAIKEYVSGRPTDLENAWNIYDHLHQLLLYNLTGVYPPVALVDQAQHWAGYHEYGIFSSKDTNGIGNIAGRTILHTILESIEQIASKGNNIKFMLIETSYQSFISFFSVTGVIAMAPDLAEFPDFSAAIAIELHRESKANGTHRDFLHVKFKNGHDARGFDPLPMFGYDPIPLSEFIFHAENIAITSNKQWMQTCGIRPRPLGILGLSLPSDDLLFYIMGFLTLGSLIFSMVIFFKKCRVEQRLAQQSRAQEVSRNWFFPVYADYCPGIHLAGTKEGSYKPTKSDKLDSRKH